MKKITAVIYVLFLLLQNESSAQNWSVFNKNYRYNYKYDNSQLVSQVLFADSVKVTGNDTMYYMNRIGVECSGTCPGLTVALTTTETVIVPNMPQFLQRKIKKYQNGLVMLVDTAKLIINAACQPGQSWLFDSINNKSATCLTKTTQLIFGINDTIKTILLGSADTLKLSRQFGLIQFPDLYGKNKYYRLAGIENRATYDSTSLYGEKVPNAWDFYKFEVGERFCYNRSSQYTLHSPSPSCITGNFNILMKTISASGYSYSVDENWDTCMVYNYPRYLYDAPGSTGQRVYSNLTSDLLENVMYPGQVILTSYYPAAPGYNIVKYAKDNNGIFFKYAGISCGVLNFTLPYLQDMGYVVSTHGYLEQGINGTLTAKKVAEVYGVGLGVVQKRLWESGWIRDYCLVCSLKNGTLTGTETYVGIHEQTADQTNIKIYPNPSSDKIHLSVGKTSANELRIVSVLGEIILSLNKNLGEQELELDLGDKPTGIYFVQLLKDGTLLKSSKIIRN